MSRRRQVIGKMKRSHIDLIDLMEHDLRYSGTPDAQLLPLISLKQEAKAKPADEYNVADEYGSVTLRALTTQRKVLVGLSRRLTVASITHTPTCITNK